MNVQDYKILEALNPANLENMVKEYLQQRYELFGTPYSTSVGLYCQAMIKKDINNSITLQDSVNCLKQQLNQDSSLRQSYQSNIAMSIYDVFIKLEIDDRQMILHFANEAADNFLNIFVL